MQVYLAALLRSTAALKKCYSLRASKKRAHMGEEQEAREREEEKEEQKSS